MPRLPQETVERDSFHTPVRQAAVWQRERSSLSAASDIWRRRKGPFEWLAVEWLASDRRCNPSMFISIRPCRSATHAVSQVTTPHTTKTEAEPVRREGSGEVQRKQKRDSKGRRRCKCGSTPRRWSALSSPPASSSVSCPVLEENIAFGQLMFSVRAVVLVSSRPILVGTSP